MSKSSSSSEHKQKHSAQTVLRGILPLLAFSAEGILPFAVQLPVKAAALASATAFLLSDMINLVKDCYNDIFNNNSDRHIRKTITNLSINSLQLYLSSITTLALAWHNNLFDNIFQENITEKIKYIAFTGANLCKAGIMLIFNQTKKYIKNGKLDQYSDWISKNSSLIGFSLILNNLLTVNSNTLLLIKPLAFIYAIFASLMIIETLNHLIYNTKANNNDPWLAGIMYSINLLSWVSMFLLAKQTIAPVELDWLPFSYINNNVNRIISAVSIVTSEILCECFCSKYPENKKPHINPINANNIKAKDTEHTTYRPAHDKNNNKAMEFPRYI